MMFAYVANAQPWTYKFGTTIGALSTSNTASTTFLNGLSATPAGGGTYRVRVSNSQGGSFNVDNPGTSLGTTGELRIVAPTGASSGKFGVYDWTSPSALAYVKSKMR